MTDITHTYLEAALLDQRIAGAFHNKVYAYIAVVAKRGWILGIAVANERGYHETGKSFDDVQEARAWARGLNEHIGLSEDEAMRIVISTMGGQRYQRAA